MSSNKYVQIFGGVVCVRACSAAAMRSAMGSAPQHYVRFVARLQQHYATVSDERILLSFGRLPCICAAQGTREKKLDVGVIATLEPYLAIDNVEWA